MRVSTSIDHLNEVTSNLRTPTCDNIHNPSSYTHTHTTRAAGLEQDLQRAGLHFVENVHSIVCRAGVFANNHASAASTIEEKQVNAHPTAGEDVMVDDARVPEPMNTETGDQESDIRICERNDGVPYAPALAETYRIIEMDTNDCLTALALSACTIRLKSQLERLTDVIRTKSKLQ